MITDTDTIYEMREVVRKMRTEEDRLRSDLYDLKDGEPWKELFRDVERLRTDRVLIEEALPPEVGKYVNTKLALDLAVAHHSA